MPVIPLRAGRVPAIVGVAALLGAQGAAGVAASLNPSPAAGSDPFADTVVAYEPGADANESYLDPGTTLGSPERFTGEALGYPGVVSEFVPAFGTDEIVSIGRGGSLVVRFDEPVTDDPDNPFGIDLIVLAVEFNRFLSYYKNAPDLNVDAGSSYDRKGGRKQDWKGERKQDRKQDWKQDRKRDRNQDRSQDRKQDWNQDRKQEKRKDIRKSQKGFSRFYINMGTKNNLDATRLIGLVNEQSRNRNIEIGKIDIMRKFSFFEIETKHESDVLEAFKKDVEFEGEKVTLDISKPEPLKNTVREDTYKSKGPKKKGGKRKTHQRK